MRINNYFFKDDSIIDDYHQMPIDDIEYEELIEAIGYTATADIEF